MVQLPIYVVSDIHGDLKQLHQAHARIAKDAEKHGVKDHTILHIGDLVDRREDSKGVIQYLMDGINDDNPWIVLMGNHDRMMFWWLNDPDRRDSHLKPGYDWIYHRIGGRETLESYGVTYPEEGFDVKQVQQQALAAIPKEHIDFLQNLPLYVETDDYIFVHAGIRPNVPMSEQTEDDLVWIRGPFFEHTESFGKMVIHGHTIVDHVTHYGNRINVDTGAAWGGPISTIIVDDTGVLEIKPDGSRVDIPMADNTAS